MTLDELEAMPELAVIVDADGLAHQKHRGVWKAFFDRHGSSSAFMLDPGIARQPLRRIV